jgi:alkylated DNA repair dioxygenase AlkB
VSEKIQRLSVDEQPAKLAASAAAAPACFSEKGYLVLKNLVSGPALAFLREYAMKSVQFAEQRREDPLSPGTPNWFADSITESLLEALLPYLEIETGIKLHPTYAVLRVYKHGDILRHHKDRPSCEISVSLSIGNKPDEAWPIWVERDGVAQGIALEPGDGLVYKGVEMTHWRDRFPGESAAQILLHYEDQDGPFKEWALDKREKLASTPVTRQILEEFRPYFHQQSGDSSAISSSVGREV